MALELQHGDAELHPTTTDAYRVQANLVRCFPHWSSMAAVRVDRRSRRAFLVATIDGREVAAAEVSFVVLNARPSAAPASDIERAAARNVWARLRAKVETAMAESAAAA